MMLGAFGEFLPVLLQKVVATRVGLLFFQFLDSEFEPSVSLEKLDSMCLGSSGQIEADAVAKVLPVFGFVFWRYFHLRRQMRAVFAAECAGDRSGRGRWPPHRLAAGKTDPVVIAHDDGGFCRAPNAQVSAHIRNRLLRSEPSSTVRRSSCTPARARASSSCTSNSRCSVLAIQLCIQVIATSRTPRVTGAT